MIRFVDLGRQLWVDETDEENPRQFAFFNTINDKFIEFDGYQVFDSWAEFEEIYNGIDHDPRTTLTIERLRNLCHPWVFEKSDKVIT